MNYQTPIEQGIFARQEPLEEMYPFKEDQQDRTTNNLTPEDHHFNTPFEASPPRDSYFFTPNSPQPLLLDFSGLNDESGRRRQRHIPHITSTGASISRKLNLQQQPDEMEQEYPCGQHELQVKKNTANRSARNAKGLRNLSESVYIIVSELNITRYKQVADRLVAEITADTNPTDGRIKDQHNIKRRVYDALNVLIAAGLLRKEGKMVACNQPYLHTRVYRHNNPKQLREKQKLEGELAKGLEKLKEKQDKLEKLQHKKNLLEFIIKRNQSEGHTSDKMLRFPLIGMVCRQPAVTNRNGTFVFRFEEEPALHGDVDMLLRINKDKIEMDSLLEDICCGKTTRKSRDE